MAKQEKIQEAYGDNWETVKNYVDENGWLSLSAAVRLNIGEIGSRTYQFKDFEKGNHKYCRILTLSELETNNGWIKIESEDELPKQTGQYWILADGEMYLFFVVNEGKLIYSTCTKGITHYQPVVKPQHPIY